MFYEVLMEKKAARERIPRMEDRHPLAMGLNRGETWGSRVKERLPGAVGVGAATIGGLNLIDDYLVGRTHPPMLSGRTLVNAGLLGGGAALAAQNLRKVRRLQKERDDAHEEKRAGKADLLDKIYRGLRAESQTLRAARDAGEDVADAIAKNRAARHRAIGMRHRVEQHVRKMRDRNVATYTPDDVYRRRMPKTDVLGRVTGQDGVKRMALQSDTGAGFAKSMPNLDTPAGYLHAQNDFMNRAGAYYADGELITVLHPSGYVGMKSGPSGPANATRSFFDKKVLPEIRAQQAAGREVTWRPRMGRTNKYHKTVSADKLTDYM